MIKRSEMQKIASEYTDPKIGVLGSHSALEIMDGAKDEEFETVVYCQKGREIWIELKSIQGNKSQLSPFQIAWLYNRTKAGGTCYVLIRKKKEIRLFQIKTLEGYQDLSWNSEHLLATTVPYDWPHLFNAIYHGSSG